MLDTEPHTYLFGFEASPQSRTLTDKSVRDAESGDAQSISLSDMDVDVRSNPSTGEFTFDSSHIFSDLCHKDAILAIAHRPLGDGRFEFLPDPVTREDLEGLESYHPDTPRASVLATDGEILATAENISVGGSTVPSLTYSDPTISDTASWPRTDYEYALAAPEPDQRTQAAGESDYTTTPALRFRENPVPCLFWFTSSCCSLRFRVTDGFDEWRLHLETHLPNGEGPSNLQCLYRSCTYNYSFPTWYEFIGHMFSHFSSQPAGIDLVDVYPDKELLNYCHRHEMIGRDTYYKYKALSERRLGEN
jgi:hypothetical protein